MADGPSILVVEDDATLRLGLELNLRAEGFRVASAADGETGLQKALNDRPALIVLDLGLPRLDGLDVLVELRRRGHETPVIVLSARTTVDDRIQGLRTGADDYLTKPFSIGELTARIQAALRRAAMTRGPTRLAFGKVELDLDARTLHSGGQVVATTPREFDLLAYLAVRPGRTLSREQLLDAVWGHDYEGTDRTVDNFIRILRAKLEVDPAAPRHLITVRGAGYRFDP